MYEYLSSVTLADLVATQRESMSSVSVLADKRQPLEKSTPAETQLPANA
jgi:hypothetical protein